MRKGGKKGTIGEKKEGKWLLDEVGGKNRGKGQSR